MKHLIISILILLSLSASAQKQNGPEPFTPIGTTTSAVKVMGRFYADSASYLALKAPIWTPLRPGAHTFSTAAGHHPYFWDSTRWVPYLDSMNYRNYVDTFFSRVNQVDDSTFIIRHGNNIADTIQLVGVGGTTQIADTNFIRNQYAIRENKKARFDSANATKFITASNAQLTGNLFLPNVTTHPVTAYGDGIIRNSFGDSVYDFRTQFTSTFTDDFIRFPNIGAGDPRGDDVIDYNSSTKEVHHVSANTFIWNYQSPFPGSEQTANFSITGTGEMYGELLRGPLHYVISGHQTDVTADLATANHAVQYPDAGGTICLGPTGSAVLDFPSTSAGTSSELTIAVSGAVDGDVVVVGLTNASSSANSCFTARGSASNVVTVKFNNYSSGAIDPASGTFKVRVIK